MSSHNQDAASDSLSLPTGSGLYVDVENLHSDAQILVQDLIREWPSSAPPLIRLSLYVPADKVELWRLWVTSRYPDLTVVVSGTQHFSMSSSKNSADLAIATNAIADLVLGRIGHVAVFSDDSDFISLYVAIRDEPTIPSPEGKPPFLWIVTDRAGSLSSTVKHFFPLDQLHVVGAAKVSPHKVATPAPEKHTEGPHVPTPAGLLWPEMAQAVIEDIPIGPFKSSDCQPVIKKRWPDHPLAKAGGPAFGTEFKSKIWPLLQDRDVTIRNPGKKPIRYEMTPEAKEHVSRG